MGQDLLAGFLGTWSAELNLGSVLLRVLLSMLLSAIVGCVDRNHGLALGLRETVLPWSSDWLYVDMSCRLSGEEATALILKTAKEKHKKASAGKDRRRRSETRRATAGRDF